MGPIEIPKLGRRAALCALGAAVASAALTSPTTARAQQRRIADARRLSTANEILIRGGYVLTVDPAIGDLPVGDVHVRDGTIVAISERIDAGDAIVIDASGSVVMPGFVETHWHMWNSIWRGMANDASAYFTLRSLGSHYTIDDHYTAVLYAACDAINSGITTCHNWAHGVRNLSDVVAEMRALRDAGIRARMGYLAVLPSGLVSTADLRSALEWIEENGEGRLSLGLLLDGAGDQLAALMRVGRELGLRTITDHGTFLAQPQLFGPELIYTHGTDLTADAIRIIAQNDLRIGLSPTSDPMIGAGLPPIYPLLTGGVPLANISFSVDVSAQAPTDPFAMMRTLVNAGRIQQAPTTDLAAIARASPDWLFSYRDAVTVGTLGGANVLGLANVTGSLTPGKRADIIVVRTNDLNMLPSANTDPTIQLVQNAQPANVDTVIVDGRVRKHGGRLVGIDQAEVVAAAARAQAALRSRAAGAVN